MNGRNTAKGQRAPRLACNLTVVYRAPFTLCFGIRKGSAAQRKPLPTPKTLQKLLHKYQRTLCTSSIEQMCIPCMAIQTRLLQLVPIHHNSKLQGTGFLVQVYLLCVPYVSALNLSIKSSIRV